MSNLIIRRKDAKTQLKQSIIAIIIINTFHNLDLNILGKYSTNTQYIKHAEASSKVIQINMFIIPSIGII